MPEIIKNSIFVKKIYSEIEELNKLIKHPVIIGKEESKIEESVLE